MQRVGGWPHLYRRGSGALYYVRRVPKDISGLLTERQFKRSLRHIDHRLPAFKAVYDTVHHEVESVIAKAREGRGLPEAQKRYTEAVFRARRFGFDYRPMAVLASEETGIEDIVSRLLAIEAKIDDKRAADVDAVLGAVPRPPITLTDALAKYEDHEKARLRGKNPDQMRRWRNPLLLAVNNFEQQIGKRALEDITRDDALNFRDWWAGRIGKDVESANTANKNIQALRKIFRTLNDALRLGLDNPFDGLRIADIPREDRVSLTREWLETTMLTGPALAKINDDARGIILAMADTGARLSEIAGLEAADIHVDAEVPHILIRPNATRTLKTAQSKREIPLVGTALAAMRDHPAGFPRYARKTAAASAVMNKYLKDAGLLPNGATLYGLRHGFQDRLIEVEAPERIQADLMGHKIQRPKYGKGPSLSQMHEWLEKTALHPQE